MLMLQLIDINSYEMVPDIAILFNIRIALMLELLWPESSQEAGVSALLAYFLISNKAPQSVLLVGQRLAGLPELEQPPGNMEASFPFAALEGSEDFSLAVEIAPPLACLFVVPKMVPSILMELGEPLQAFLSACCPVGLEECDHAFDVDPPELLVPLQVLKRTVFDVFEVKDASVLLIPGKFGCGDQDIGQFLFKSLVVEPLSYIQQEPHRLVSVPRIHQPSLKAIHKLPIGTNILKQDVVLFAQEMGHDLLDQRFNHLINFLFPKDMLHAECQIAHDHRKRKAFNIPTASALAPLTFWVVLPPLNAAIGLQSEFSIVVVLSGFVKFGKGHGCKTIRKNAVWFADGFTISRNREVPQFLLIHAIVKEKLCAMDGNLKPLLILLNLVVDHAEEPDLPGLEPDKLVGVIDVAELIEAGEVAP